MGKEEIDLRKIRKKKKEGDRDSTTILIDKKIRDNLTKLKLQKETYNELLRRLIDEKNSNLHKNK